MELLQYAKDIQQYLLKIYEIKACNLYGSLIKGNYDDYSDIDIEIDVSGIDNSLFITKIKDILSLNYNIIFSDYAPSLAPETYIISLAISNENPFAIIDIKCIATPHFKTLTKEDLILKQNNYDHILKLFVANLKHYLRRVDCLKDIQKMYKKVYINSPISKDKHFMLDKIFLWLKENSTDKYNLYLKNLEKYL